MTANGVRIDLEGGMALESLTGAERRAPAFEVANRLGEIDCHVNDSAFGAAVLGIIDRWSANGTNRMRH